MRLVWMWLGAGACLLAGCDDTLFGVPVGGGDPIPVYSVDWAGVEAMYDDHCTDCHPSLNAWILDTLEQDVRDGTESYVVAGDAEASQLWRMISNTREDGDAPVMPLGSQGLLANEREHVRLWIDAGAILPEGE